MRRSRRPAHRRLRRLGAVGLVALTLATVPVSSPLRAIGDSSPRGHLGATALAPAASLPAAGSASTEGMERAVRGVRWTPDASCDLDTMTAIGGRHPEVRQLVLVASTSFAATTATVEVGVRDVDGTWRCQLGAQAARVGRNGTRPLLDRRSGDGTTPAGVFPLGSVTAWDGQTLQFFGNGSDPGVLGTYRDVRYEDCWGATPGTARYQHLVNRPQCSGDDEWLTRYGDVYRHAAVIGANLDPVSGDQPGETPYAAAIFLHRHSYSSGGATKPTSGCVSLALDPLIDTLRQIDPALDPHFAIGPLDWLRSTA